MVKGNNVEAMLDMPLDEIGMSDMDRPLGGGNRGMGMRRRGASSVGKWSRGGGTSGGRIRGLASNIPSGRRERMASNNMRSDPDSGARWGKDRSAGHVQRRQTRRSTLSRPVTRREPSPVKRRARISTTGNIKITGLQEDVTSDCVKEIFEERIGVVMQAYVLYNRDGKSTGTAKVTFGKISEARAAIDRLDKSLVDGKEIRIRMDNDDEEKIEKVSSSPRRKREPERSYPSPTNYGTKRGRGFSGGMASNEPAFSSTSRARSRTDIGDIPSGFDNPLDRRNDLQPDADFGTGGNNRSGSFRGRGGGRGGFRGRGRGRGGFGRGGNRGGFGSRSNDEILTNDDLDKELDEYMKS